jgi:hypothetical protein
MVSAGESGKAPENLCGTRIPDGMPDQSSTVRNATAQLRWRHIRLTSQVYMVCADGHYKTWATESGLLMGCFRCGRAHIPAGIARKAQGPQFSDPRGHHGAFVVSFAGHVDGSLLALLNGFLAQFGAVAVEFRLMSAGCHGNGSLCGMAGA